MNVQQAHHQGSVFTQQQQRQNNVLSWGGGGMNVQQGNVFTPQGVSLSRVTYSQWPPQANVPAQQPQQPQPLYQHQHQQHQQHHQQRQQHQQQQQLQRRQEQLQRQQEEQQRQQQQFADALAREQAARAAAAQQQRQQLLQLQEQQRRLAATQAQMVADARASRAQHHAAAAAPPTAVPSRKVLAPGSRAAINYHGLDRVFPGTVETANADGSYAIAYDDGDREDNVPAALVRPLVLEAGCRATVSDRSGVTKSGTVVARNGDLSVAITFDDGEAHASVPSKLLRPSQDGWHSPLTAKNKEASVAPTSPVIVGAPNPSFQSPVCVAATATSSPPPMMPASRKHATALDASAAKGGNRHGSSGSPGGTRAKLFAWRDAADGEKAGWTSRGLGELKLEGGGNGRMHFVLRSQATFKILFNAPLFAGMPACKMGQREVQLVCCSFLRDAASDRLVPDGSASPRKWLIRVPDANVADALVAAVKQHAAPS